MHPSVRVNALVSFRPCSERSTATHLACGMHLLQIQVPYKTLSKLPCLYINTSTTVYTFELPHFGVAQLVHWPFGVFVSTNTDPYL